MSDVRTSIPLDLSMGGGVHDWHGIAGRMELH